MPKLVYFLYFLLFGFLQLITNADDLNVKKAFGMALRGTTFNLTE